MSVRRLLASAVVAAALCVVLPRQAPAQTGALKIGVVMSFSGPGSTLGRSVRASLDAWLQMHHNLVGGRTVNMIYRDDAHAPETARRLAQELVVSDHIDVLLGASSAPEAAAMDDVSTQAKVPFFIINATNPGLLEKAPYAVRTSYLTPDFGPPLARWVTRNGIKTVYAIYADYSSGTDTLEALTAGMAAAGGKVIGSVAVPLDITDFSAYLLRAKDARPDAVFAFVGGGPSSINIVKQFASSGLKQTMKLIGTADLISDELLPAEGPAALDIVTASNYSADHNSKLNHDYVRIYKQVIANPQPADIPTFISVQAFDAMTMIDHSVGLQKGAIDAQKTIDSVRGYAFESPRGPIRIDAQTREVHESMYIRKTEMLNGTPVNAEVAAFPPQ